MLKPLGQAITDQVYSHMREGLELAKQGRHQEAAVSFRKSWELVPEPKYEWDLSKITLFRLAKFFRDSGFFAEAHEWIDQVAKCPVQLGDGLMELTKGAIFLAAGDSDAAFIWFDKAYAAGGKRAFQGEDPKYLSFLKTRRKV